MIVTHTVRALLSLVLLNLSLFTNNLQAQTVQPAQPAQQTEPTLVQEADLRACLVLEQEGIQRFKKLETVANDLRAIENALSGRRTALQNQQNKLKDNSINPETKSRAITSFNESVNEFNQQADQLNANKVKLDLDVANNDNWMNKTLKPVCEKVINKPVNPVTSYHACGHGSKQGALDVPHCASLPNLESLKTCIEKSGSKTKALESCKG